MQSKNTLHILNGQAMYNHFKKTGFLKQEMVVPFNEAMCYGDVSIDLFSDDFIATRAKVHHVTLSQYEETTLKPLHPLFIKKFTHIALWFDYDMFCQINILTILAWLDQTNHLHPIDLHLVGDHFEPLEKIVLEAKGYDSIYKQVLIKRSMPQHIYPAPLKKGVELYLNYQNQDGELITYIHKHEHLPERELLFLLLHHFKDYGLGDTQYTELITNNRKRNN